MPSSADRVTDDSGVEFVLGKVIAAGAQGTVYRVEGHPDRAIKLLTRREYLARIAAVRRLPLDQLPVAAPITLITSGKAGYVMRLASDMSPVRQPYLPQEFGARETRATWYMETGGLSRRLAIAASMAQTLAALHERGLAYVDLNPNNVMVSDDFSRTETWLIDTDNLTSRAQPEWDVVGFPGYAAPERARHFAPPSTLADAYVLAVHVFRMLVLRHPLEGLAVEDLDAGESRARMDRGEFAYVDDPDDSSNRIPERIFPAGIFPLVMSGRMRALAVDTFGSGRLTPRARPGSARWRDVLYHALDNVVACPAGCGWTYFRLRSACPSCGEPSSPPMVLTIYPGPAGSPLIARDSLVVRPDEDTVVAPRHLWGRHDLTDPVLTLRPARGGLQVVAHDDAVVADPEGKPVSKIRTTKEGQVNRLVLTCPNRPLRHLAIRTVHFS